MKFSVQAVDLADAVLRVSKACAGKTTVAVLECIKMAAHNDILTLTATDGELAIEEKLNVDVIEEGDICVPGKTFTDFVCRLSFKQIVLSTTEKGLKIEYEDSESYIQYLSAEDFPDINLEIRENSFVMEKEKFKSLIARTAFCCATDDARPILRGCLIETSSIENTVTMTALDGYRLAVGSEAVKRSSTDLKIVCPSRTLNEISRMLGEEDEDITVFVQSGMIMVNIGRMVITSRLYQGEFINRHAIIPKTFTTVVTLDKSELDECISRAVILLRGDKNNLIIMDIKNGEMRITSSSDIGGADEKISAGVEGKELKIAMNAKYLSDAIRAVDDDQVILSFNSPASPFTCTKAEDSDYLYLILPVRTGS